MGVDAIACPRYLAFFQIHLYILNRADAGVELGEKPGTPPIELFFHKVKGLFFGSKVQEALMVQEQVELVRRLDALLELDQSLSQIICFRRPNVSEVIEESRHVDLIF